MLAMEKPAVIEVLCKFVETLALPGKKYVPWPGNRIRLC